MNTYHRLTQGERYQIESLLKSGLSVREVGRVLNRSPSTISRELSRNKGTRGYNARKSNLRAKKVRSQIHPPKKLQGLLAKRVQRLLGNQWSPEQISGRLRLEGVKISHETIYQYIYVNYRCAGKLYFNLRRRRKIRRSRNTTRNLKRSGKSTDRTLIDQRPSVVDKRCRVGDFERDLVLGNPRTTNLLTIVDRVSKLSKISRVGKINGYQVHRATIRLLEGLPIKTITNDNGSEFSLHAITSASLGIPIYFNHPYCSWQRGTNENTNGLIRQYFPKGTDFGSVSDDTVKKVEDLLNHRPRKTLGYKTPFEVQSRLCRVLR